MAYWSKCSERVHFAQRSFNAKAAAYFPQQANEFRRLAEAGHDEKLAAELPELAEWRDKIADAIETNLSIRQRN